MSSSSTTLATPETTENRASESARCEVIRVENLRKVYRSGRGELQVLAGVNFSLVSGEMVAITGASGTGKSTFLHLLAALDTPTSGAVYFQGRALETLSEAERADFRRRSIGYVWQQHHLLPDFTAAENVATPLLLGGAPHAKAINVAQEWLKEVGLGDRGEQAASELSGGEQQRVAIARALVSNPKLFLADEPTGDLDEGNAEAVFGLLQRLHRSRGLTSLVATHNLGLAQRCDRVLALHHGFLSPRSSIPDESYSGPPTAAAGGAERKRE
jgi:lipoprotein-releasing system ATP-binding protein